MFPSRFFATLLAICCVVLWAPLLANSGQSPAGHAASLYEQGDFDKAFKQYHKMAKDGHTFAQYRVSYMTLMGLGTRRNVVESLAWAVVAAEGDDETLDRYQDAVAAMVPADDRKKAQKKADYFLRRWGKDDEPDEEVVLRKSKEVCTGSRLSRNCGDSGSTSGYWISWGQDKSADPVHREHIEKLNQTIVENAASLKSNATDS